LCTLAYGGTWSLVSVSHSSPGLQAVESPITRLLPVQPPHHQPHSRLGIERPSSAALYPGCRGFAAAMGHRTEPGACSTNATVRCVLSTSMHMDTRHEQKRAARTHPKVSSTRCRVYRESATRHGLEPRGGSMWVRQDAPSYGK